MKPLPDGAPASQGALRAFFLHGPFALLWTGQTVSLFGSYISELGLPLIAVLLLGATPAQLGLLVALGALPGVGLALLIGVWVDRLSGRTVMLVADIGRALLLTLIPLLAATGLLHIAWLALIAALIGVCSVGFEVASLSFLPCLLQPEELFTGNSRLATSSSLAEVAGPPLAALLIGSLTAPLAVLLDACSFLFSALCLSLIRPPGPSVEPDLPVERASTARQISQGLRTLLSDPRLRALAAYTGLRSFFGGTFAALYLIYTFRLFGALPCSLLVACGGLGAFLGSCGAAWCARRFGSGPTLIGAALLFGVLAFGTPLAAGPAPVAFLLLAFSQLLGDTGFAVYAISEISLRQQLVPQAVLGRVSASLHMLSVGALPPGALLAGLLSELIGMRLTLLVGACGLLLAVACLLFSPLRHSR
jgi:predicted MFS family arabinose efflux permease